MSEALVDRAEAVPAVLRTRATAHVAVLASAAAASALLLWTSSPAVGVGWLAWIALVPALAVALHDPATRSARLTVPLAYALYLELLLVPALPFGLARDQWADDPVLPVMVGD